MANRLFYTLAALATLVFFAGMVSHLRFWLSELATNQQAGTSRVTLLLREIPHTLARRRTWQAWFHEGLLQQQIWCESRLRWCIHVGLSWGFTELLFATSADLLIRHNLLPFTKDTPWFATLNELGGLLLVIGAILALYRRLVMKPQHLYTDAQDLLILVWLLVLGLGGYLAEAARFGVEGTPASVARWSFAGYSVYRGLLAMGIEPADLLGLAWWTHAIAALGLIAVLPYTKLLHIFTAPIALILETAKSTPETIAEVPPGWVPSPHLQQIARAAGRDTRSSLEPASLAEGGDG